MAVAELDRVVLGEPVGDPFRCLATSVIYQAFADEAWGWLMGRDPEMALWADCAGVPPEAVMRRARELGGDPDTPDYGHLLAMAPPRPGRPRKDDPRQLWRRRAGRYRAAVA